VNEQAFIDERTKMIKTMIKHRQFDTRVNPSESVKCIKLNEINYLKYRYSFSRMYSPFSEKWKQGEGREFG